MKQVKTLLIASMPLAILLLPRARMNKNGFVCCLEPLFGLKFHLLHCAVQHGHHEHGDHFNGHATE